ncbi:MAG: hypothetical protein CVU79_00730 [Elusimicrobia bacterium HGW-Elusimicrobia-3]|nr:MAG: hypothetical protein CVU79_00730 [Elusimicrobia bacterium HGW-Elusimicrobia-3]
MNFYNEDEKKADIPVIPGAASPFRKTSAFGKAPMFSRAAGSFVDRLKNLSRRDMAFVGIGLSVLVMAPVAEYMISQPSQDNVLKGNDFAQRHGDAGPFEPGIHGLSQGSADGSGEVITPLTSRDPASLILGSQSSQPVLPPAVTAPPSSSWRDAVTDSGRAAFSAATKSVGAPTVIPKMSASLRGFTSFGGDGSSRTSGTLGGGKIIDDAKSASSKAAKRSMIGPVAMAGYKGVASGTPNSASKGAFEKLRGAADKSASNFSGGSAMSSLDKAAADAVQIGAGTGGAGGLGEGEKTKGSNNYDNKYKHERSGESLAEMAAKERQKKALEWEFFKKYEIKKTIVKAVVEAFSTTLGKFLTGQMEGALGMTPGSAPKCYTTVREEPDWAAAEAAVAAGTAASTLEYVCKADGGPIVVSYQMGKEAASSMKKKCICDSFAGSTGSAAPGTTPGGANPIVPGATPDQIAANTAENISDYDSVLKTVVLPAVKGYHKVAKKSVDGNMQPKAVDKEEEQEVTLALNDAMTKLNTAATSSVTNAITAKNAAARKELNTYGRAVNTASSLVASSKAKQNIDQLDRLRAAAAADAAAGKCTVKLNTTTAQTGSEVAAAKANCEAIVARIDGNESYKTGKGSFNLAKDALKSHTRRNAVLGTQMDAMDGAVSAMMTRHATVPVKVKAILDVAEGKTMLAKIEEIIAKDADIPADPVPAAKSNEDKKPLLIAIEDLRGITLASFWEEEFDAKHTVTAEQTAWEPFDKAAGTEAPGTLGAPVNFEAAVQRPNEMITSIAGAKKGLSDIATLLDTAETNTQATVDDLKELAAPCNFTEAGCAASTTGETPDVKPDPIKPDPIKPEPIKPDPIKPDPIKPNPNAASADEVAEAEANLAIIRSVHRYGVGVENGASNCTNAQSDIIRVALNDSNALMRGTLTKNDVAVIERNVQSACNVLSKCNRAGYAAAGCN